MHGDGVHAQIEQRGNFLVGLALGDQLQNLLFTVGEFAIVGIGAYRTGFNRPRAKMGLQSEKIGETAIWILPNPSGLNANYQAADLAEKYRELRDWLNG